MSDMSYVFECISEMYLGKMNLFKVCSIKIESMAYYKEDLVFAWFPRLASRNLHDVDRNKVSSEDERLSPSIEFEDDIELSQYKLQG